METAQREVAAAQENQVIVKPLYFAAAGRQTRPIAAMMQNIAPA